MRLAILGATGQIGRSLARAYAPRCAVTLFARRPEAAAAFLERHGLQAEVQPYDRLPERRYDLIVNAAGDGVPGRIRGAGPAILEVTERFDRLCLEAQERHPGTGYVFLSTGAIYGPDYREALAPDPVLRLPLGRLDAGLFYPLAKRLAELRHRADPERPVADIRIFGFVSPQIDLESDFLVAQMLRAAVEGGTFRTGPADVPRDYIAAEDLVGFLDLLAERGCPNGAYDLLSAAPTSKLRLLAVLAERLGLDVRVEGEADAPLALPPRLSVQADAEPLGFRPERTSLDNVLAVAEVLRAERLVPAGSARP